VPLTIHAFIPTGLSVTVSEHLVLSLLVHTRRTK